MGEPMSMYRVLSGPTPEEMEAAQRDVLVGETYASIGRDWAYWYWLCGLSAAAAAIQLLRSLP